MNKFKTWLLVRAVKHFLKEEPMNTFLATLFSTDSIWGRIVRAVILALLGGATGGATLPGDVHLPAWIVSILGALAGMIPAGQTNPKP